MAKIYSTDGKILTGDNFPQIQIGKELFVVDDRKSIYDKIQKVVNESKRNPQEDKDYDMEVIKLALGNENAKKIAKLDLSVRSFNELTKYIMAAIQGIEYEEIDKAMSSKN